MKMYLIRRVVFFLVPVLLSGQSILNTVHNLSVDGPGTTKAVTETEVCIFCHAPHNSNPQTPLWNKQTPATNYILYNSSTIQASPGQPDGSSILCLSCHDGTIALGSVLNRVEPIQFGGGVTTMPAGSSNLSTQLSDDHPVSFIYNSSLAIADGELVDPVGLNGPVQLSNQKVQCSSCHDAHSDLNDKFLVASNRYSDLCLFCHQKPFWDQSSHSTSNAGWSGNGTDPWPHTPFNTVAENACENCHMPHNAGSNERLLNSATEETNCIICHDTNVASVDIQSEISKPYSHDVYAYSQVHDTNESTQVQAMHVECSDCHNPHASNNSTATAPAANGFLSGVRGIDTNGNPVSVAQNEYEVCYRCHAGSSGSAGSPTSRQFDQNNTRLEFDLNNTSYHPIEGVGQNGNVPSLISPLTESSIIYCTDCHASDAVNAAMGPHGSIYPQILKYRYETVDNTKESYQVYRLCYECHDRNSLLFSMSKVSKKVHKEHVVGEDIPCNICHDPHGISASQGNQTSLINFDLSVVSPYQNRLEFIDRGNSSGECYLVCHGETHKPKKY